MLHLPGDRVKSRGIFIIVISRKKYFLKVLSGTKALSYYGVQLSGDHTTAKLHQYKNTVPTHQYFRGNMMDIHRGWFFAAKWWLLTPGTHFQGSAGEQHAPLTTAPSSFHVPEHQQTNRNSSEGYTRDWEKRWRGTRGAGQAAIEICQEPFCQEAGETWIANDT